ncbi:MAG: VIT1/CCC1 transporter family protein [Candidatus Hodarchaeota archaeon]
MIDPSVEKSVRTAQRNEITEYHIYKKLAKRQDNPHNQAILNRIAEDELRHYRFWKTFTNREMRPNSLLIWFYYIVARIFGLTFGVRLMELGEGRVQVNYSLIVKSIPEAQTIIIDEEAHEQQLIELLDEELLDYMGSVVLGLNDALVELTGALAGFTLAFQDTHLIAIAGLITGIAASLSMGTSEYLSIKSEIDTSKSPLKASLYTGTAYLGTVFFLISPYIIFNNQSPLVNLAIVLVNAIIIVFLFTSYISIAKNIPFKKRFFEIVSVSLGIAAFTFILGIVVRSVLNVEI